MRRMARLGERIAERLRGFASPWELACFGWLPALMLGYVAWQEWRGGIPVGDYGIFRTAARKVLSGETPYPPATRAALSHFSAFVYPPASALVFSPAAVLPFAVGRVAILVLSIAGMVVALRLLGVRDWRCYGLSLLPVPVVNSLTLGAITPFLLVGVAALWRYRDRSTAAGTTAALTAVAKLFLWPLAVWLVLRARLRAAVVFAAVSVVAIVGGWALIGFAGIGSYPHLLNLLSRIEAPVSYSPLALIGGGAAGSVWAALVVSAAVVGAVALAARGPDGDRRAFTVAIVGALLATPIAWLHYYVLLFVPIALYRPRLSPLWFAPLLFWATPSTHANGSAWSISVALVLTLVVLVPGLGGRPRSILRPALHRRARRGAVARVFYGLGRGAESA
jgi:alpha-1,2-mannosyltransferase